MRKSTAFTDNNEEQISQRKAHGVNWRRIISAFYTWEHRSSFIFKSNACSEGQNGIGVSVLSTFTKVGRHGYPKWHRIELDAYSGANMQQKSSRPYRV